MSNCCDTTITVPSNCTPRCPQLVDACCVINADNLDCLFPEVLGTGDLVAYGYNIIGVSITAPKTLSDLVVGMTVFYDGEALGKIAGVAGNIVTLDTALTSSVTRAELTFKKVEIEQCEINQAVNDALCALQDGTVPCNTYTEEVSLNQADFDWAEVSPYSDLLVSNKMNCLVRFRGVIKCTNLPGTQTFLVSTVLFTLGVALRPAVEKLIPTVIQVTDPAAEQRTAIYIPGFIVIGTNGQVTLSVIYPNPCWGCDGKPYFNIGHTLEMIVTLDNIIFDTQA